MDRIEGKRNGGCLACLPIGCNKKGVGGEEGDRLGEIGNPLI